MGRFRRSPVLADWIRRVAESLGVGRTVLCGSSGGVAALQVSAESPDSICVTLNPRISINNYLVEGVHMGPQRRYVEVVWPHLAPVPLASLRPNVDWHSGLGDRVTAGLRYKQNVNNRVLYVQSTNDTSHVHDHYQPFRDVVSSGPNRNLSLIHISEPTRLL